MNVMAVVIQVGINLMLRIHGFIVNYSKFTHVQSKDALQKAKQILSDCEFYYIYSFSEHLLIWLPIKLLLA